MLAHKSNNLENLSDEELMCHYQLGEEQAFKILYQRHSAKVYGFLINSVKDRSFADDIFQGIFLKLHQVRAQYNPNFPFIAWLFTITKTVLIDHIRKNKKSIEVQNNLAFEQAPQPDEQPSPALPPLPNLPATQKKAFELRYAGQMSFEQIAQQLNTSPGNARKLVSRAIKKIKQIVVGGKNE